MTQGFDEWLDTTKLRGYIDENSLEAAWDAGQQSKQAEINDLQSKLETAEKNLNNAFKTIKFEQQYQEELQNRIDGAVKELELIHFYKTQNSNNAIKILKGESNE